MITDLYISSRSTSSAPTSMSSSSLKTSRATYAFLSLPNIFQISALMELVGAVCGRLFCAGGESLRESERCRFRMAAGGSLEEDLFEDMDGRAGAFSDCDVFLEG